MSNLEDSLLRLQTEEEKLNRNLYQVSVNVNFNDDINQQSKFQILFTISNAIFLKICVLVQNIARLANQCNSTGMVNNFVMLYKASFRLLFFTKYFS
jgi:hypothetical protein